MNLTNKCNFENRKSGCYISLQHLVKRDNACDVLKIWSDECIHVDVTIRAVTHTFKSLSKYTQRNLNQQMEGCTWANQASQETLGICDTYETETIVVVGRLVTCWGLQTFSCDWFTHIEMCWAHSFVLPTSDVRAFYMCHWHKSISASSYIYIWPIWLIYKLNSDYPKVGNSV